MAGEEAAAEGSQSRRRMDLNLYLGLPPLPRPPGRLDAGLDCPSLIANPTGPEPQAPEMGEPEESLAPAAAYSPSNALSTPEEQPMLDPVVYAWLDGHSTDGEEDTDAPDHGANVSQPLVAVSQPLVADSGLEGDDLTPWVERFVRPGRVASAAAAAGGDHIGGGGGGGGGVGGGGGGMEMVTTSMMRRSLQLQGLAPIEAATPELRFQRVIQISQQHSIVRSGSSNRSQRAASPEADRLVWAIQRTHNSLEAARRQKLDGDKVCGKGAAKDGCCECSSSFECNICLDPAKEPVVTPCGHLFCWPCLYQWLHAHSAHSECPVCKGEVLEVNVTPIYGRGGEEGDSANPDMPPRPRANRRDSLRQQLQMTDTRGIATVVRQLIENQGIVRGLPSPAVAEMTSRQAAEITSRQRARIRRQQRQNNNASSSTPATAIMLNTGNVSSESSNQIQLSPSNANITAPVAPAAPRLYTTAPVILVEPRSSRRSRPSSPITRRTRRRPQ
ncbi:hypothetical protein HU200_051269 [Digitaria exilis]|uniref:E3 ubiquitin-protein ligase RMA n=1 Tax=Digitaria exilis TaxID=1010633 RepID=A0A835EAS4_9POAL|nr:hypothetical protein HU200_051269 [Digitaria exilis]CAB3480103.1 unnamed protein product [Digitaria exilis]